jgi:predicted O-linked N-acetylglucosamine transferase (SPINDLY family)
VGTFIEPILANHDHAAFEVVCYCDVPRPDAVTQRLRAFADQWHSIIGMTDEQLAGKIRQDGIDILVDLAGHTADNRLRTLARKPAPVQVTYIGYPDTTGLRAVDYRITDGDADPPGLTEQYHTESLIRLPGPFPCYSAPAEAPQANALPALSGGGVTFGSFNNFAKVTAHALALWARILDQVPGSRLLLKAASLGDLAVRQRVQEFFAGKAVSPQRLELLGREPSTRGHLSHYHRIDIALDTFPYCGTTTTCEALWMGVPVVSLAGSTHVARVGTSLLNSVGLAELSAHDEADYVRIACRLAGDLEKLAAMRITLRQRMQRSPLMDGPRLTRELEKVYREMWAEYCRNSPSSPNV